MGLTCKAEVLDWPVDHVIDGDTVQFHVSFLPKPLKPVLSLRILGVDTPEKAPRSQCVRENNLAHKATLFTKDSISNASLVQVMVTDWDKYGGRVLGDVLVDGQRLSQLLISHGYARAYFGEKKRSWCHP